MRPVVTAAEVEALIRSGGDVRGLPVDAVYTPSALDLIRDHQRRTTRAGAASGSPAAPATPPSSKSSKAELDAFFTSAYCRDIKEQICDIGRRLWQRAYVDGNGGNVAVRVGENLALCTPTLVSKGFMTPEHMCLVDFDGQQLCGDRKRTSEIMMHLQIMARQPRAAATVHCHPPYATGFAVAGIAPPSCLVSEYELFASVAIAPYRTPGTPDVGRLAADLVDQHNIVLLANHGVVSWSHLGVEDAYFKMEILEAYCRTVLVTAQLGVPANTMTPTQVQDLLKIKRGLDIPDPRHGLKDAELCDNTQWNPGVQCATPGPDGAPVPPTRAELEALVRAITDEILAQWRPS